MRQHGGRRSGGADVPGPIDRVSCEPLEWNGQTLDSTGTYLFESFSEFGCDSVTTMDFTLLSDSVTVDTLVVCDGVVWNGLTFNSDTLFLWLGSSSDGCDAEVSLDLTVHRWSGSWRRFSARPYRMEWSNARCFGEATYASTTQFGCDSVTTIDFTLLFATESVSDSVACDALTAERQHIRQHGTVHVVNDQRIRLRQHRGVEPRCSPILYVGEVQSVAAD